MRSTHIQVHRERGHESECGRVACKMQLANREEPFTGPAERCPDPPEGAGCMGWSKTKSEQAGRVVWFASRKVLSPLFGYNVSGVADQIRRRHAHATGGKASIPRASTPMRSGRVWRLALDRGFRGQWTPTTNGDTFDTGYAACHCAWPRHWASYGGYASSPRRPCPSRPAAFWPIPRFMYVRRFSSHV